MLLLDTKARIKLNIYEKLWSKDAVPDEFRHEKHLALHKLIHVANLIAKVRLVPISKTTTKTQKKEKPSRKSIYLTGFHINGE